MQCAISGCDFDTSCHKPMLAPCQCGHFVCSKCVAVWAGMPGPVSAVTAPVRCLGCQGAEAAPFEAQDCVAATGVLVALVAGQSTQAKDR
jgi:hypothetical protein